MASRRLCSNLLHNRSGGYERVAGCATRYPSDAALGFGKATQSLRSAGHGRASHRTQGFSLRNGCG